MDYKLIDTAGQITAVITSKIEIGDLPQIANSLMVNNPIIEQVGYLEGTSFRMMGGELSINGTLAAAYLLGKSGQINGYDFKLTKNGISLSLPKSIILKVDKNTVYLEGITYQVIIGFSKKKILTSRMRDSLFRLASPSPASGLIFYENNQIMPLIYVKPTDSYVWENACGSGSLSAALLTNQSDIIQPSGQIISFQFKSQNIVVTTTAKEV